MRPASQMNEKVSWLKAHEERDDTVYLLSEMKKDFEVIDFGNDGYLVLNWSTSLWLQFAVLRFHTGYDEERIFLSVIFHGEGAVGNLRECRHTWWGEEGYIFYPDGDIITSAFKHLSKYFDGMASEKSSAEDAFESEAVKKLVDTIELTIKAWTDYSPYPLSKGGQSLRKMKKALEEFKKAKAGK